MTGPNIRPLCALGVPVVLVVLAVIPEHGRVCPGPSLGKGSPFQCQKYLSLIRGRYKLWGHVPLSSLLLISFRNIPLRIVPEAWSRFPSFWLSHQPSSHEADCLEYQHGTWKLKAAKLNLENNMLKYKATHDKFLEIQNEISMVKKKKTICMKKFLNLS